MPYLNQVTLMGNLTADLECTTTPGGTSVCEFTLAINSWSQERSRAEFFDCVVFGGWEENLARSAHKGALALVEGFLAQERWVDKKSHQNRSRVRVKAQRAFHLEAKYAEPTERITLLEGPTRRKCLTRETVYGPALVSLLE